MVFRIGLSLNFLNQRRQKGPHQQQHVTEEEEIPLDPQEEERQRERRERVACAKLILGMKALRKGECNVEKDSVYGAAVILPQIARSAGWPRMLSVLVIRSYVFLLINFIAQGLVLYFIFTEELVWDLFSGQMFLCDSGAFEESCPDGPNCVGPGRTIFDPSRLYDWYFWTGRTYTRDSLKAVFPDNATDIQNLVDVGEYGVESYWCRIICIILFMVSVMKDLVETVDLARLLYHVPTATEPWISYKTPDWGDKRHVKSLHGWSENEFVKLQVAGMSLGWKMINFFMIFLPKMLLWKITCEAGVTFLMETVSMEDIIINSVVLVFILEIDEMMFEDLMSEEAKRIVSKIESMPLESSDDDDIETMDDEQLLRKLEASESTSCIRTLWQLIPGKLVALFALTLVFVAGYYRRACVRNERGGWVSQAMHLPKATVLSFMEAFFPNIMPVKSMGEPFWQYAPPGG